MNSDRLDHSSGRLKPPIGLHVDRLSQDDAVSGEFSASDRKARIYLPPQSAGDPPMPLIIALHGAGGQDGGLIKIVMHWAEANGVGVLAPRSADSTWDILRGGYGPDVSWIEFLLHWTAQSRRLDVTRIALAGFSDGASYALSLGSINAEFISDVIAFSPGFALSKMTGNPRIFISHGARDDVLPVECGRGLSQRFADGGHDVQYVEFDGGHHIPEDVAVTAFIHFLESA